MCCCPLAAACSICCACAWETVTEIVPLLSIVVWPGCGSARSRLCCAACCCAASPVTTVVVPLLPVPVAPLAAFA
uniref:Putative secreted protein n=1 Tax=Anopheles darlingi TaxID=43151 RepID=A0A2M4DN97_ANODA